VRILAHSALTISLAAALLVGCGGSHPLIGVPGAMPESDTVARARVIVHRIRTASSSYQVLYSFAGRADGSIPEASLIDVNGVLYGTTRSGGKFHRGTVFSITTSGTEHVLHGFGRIHDGKHDGESPQASLIDMGGTLYGTTYLGGAHHQGTVFKISTSGRERVLHSFDYSSGSNSDGAYPTASLIGMNGTLYGTTDGGGTQGCVTQTRGCGTVFSISADGHETVLHRFTGTDGASPNALIDVNGTFYGTTSAGGTKTDGTVFGITTSGTEHVLYSFGDSRSDGELSSGGLIDVNGTFYGTTIAGGAYTCYTNPPFGCGTVFSVSTSGAENVLHSFGDGHSDGKGPDSGLIDVNGTLYGTTYVGGASGGGTVFSITTSGTEQVVHSFSNGSQGGYGLEAGLLNVNDTLYGATVSGGTHEDGTVFALTP
jgi:uncharacterized repeat protein (TIGR03803 family)